MKSENVPYPKYEPGALVTIWRDGVPDEGLEDLRVKGKVLAVCYDYDPDDRNNTTISYLTSYKDKSTPHAAIDVLEEELKPRIP